MKTSEHIMIEDNGVESSDGTDESSDMSENDSLLRVEELEED